MRLLKILFVLFCVLLFLAVKDVFCQEEKERTDTSRQNESILNSEKSIKPNPKEQTNPAQKQPTAVTIERISEAVILDKDIDKKVTIISQSTQPQESSGWITIMSENFEVGFPRGAWSVFDDDGSTNGMYYWDEDDYNPHFPSSLSAWCANGGADSLNPEFNYYANNMKSWMIYGPFDLSDATDAELLFYYWNDSQSDKDYFKWLASINETIFYGWKVSGYSSGWQYVNFDLTDVPAIGNLTGKSSVWIAFYFGSDSSITYQGAFVDDIVLQKYTTANKPDLRVSFVTPSSYSPGVNRYDYLYTTVTVYNAGNTGAGGFWTDIYYNPVFPPTPGTPGDDFRWTSSLPYGSSDYFTFVKRNSGSVAQTYNMYSLTDSYNGVDEGNENNNTYGPVTINWSVPESFPVRTRDEIMNTALEFVDVLWDVKYENCYPTSECASWSCDPDIILLIGQSTEGVAYEWGGWDRSEDFQRLTDLKHNSYEFFKTGTEDANDCIEGGGDPFWAIGSDCSGLVSRAWNLSYKRNTSTDIWGLGHFSVSDQLPSFMYLVRGDILLKPGHVAIFYDWVNPDTMEVIEETPPLARRSKWTGNTWSPYLPYRYLNVLWPDFIAGDVNSDGVVSVGDLVWLINYVFKHGPPPEPLCKGDVNANCTVSSGDVVYLINYLFKPDRPAPQDGCAACG